MRRLAHLATTHPRRVLVATFAAFLVAVVFGAPVAGMLSSDDEFDDPDSESQVAGTRLDRLAGVDQTPALIVLVRGDDPRSRLPALEAEIAREPRVARTDRGPLSRDGRATYLAVTMKAGDDEDDVADDLAERLAGRPGVTLGGGALAGARLGDQVQSDLQRAEMIAFPFLFLLSLWVFRGLVAALLPLFVGVLTIFGTFLALRAINGGLTLSVFALNLAIAMGLGLAIDYSLFVVSRYREELARGTPDPLHRTLATAGRTVLFSAVTVAVALLALTVFPQRFLYSMGLSGAFAALTAGLVTLTALPALLRLLGPRLDARPADEGFWYRLSHFVMRRARLVAALTTAGLLLAGLPVLGIQFTGVDATTLPQGSPIRTVDTALRTEFPPAPTSPLLVTVEDGRDIGAYAQRLRGLEGVAAVDDPRPVGDLTVIPVVPRGRALDDRTLDLVRDVREPGVAVSGQSASFVDQQDALVDRLPIALAILALTTFTILFVMTGSVVLPVKALVMNVLSLSAAFGLLVLIFQDGRLEGLLDYTSQGALESTQPVLLFAVAFALSTDYGVFLLTRIKEARDAGAPNDEAVAVGLQRTGRIVTAAALLLSVALASFATSQVIFIKEVGLGTVFAVLIDATIIRALLVPSLMKLLGEWNWWAPGPLRRLHRRIGLAES
ncbi:MAG TPA: MMPL family transporter [Solirubrobacteraceae bacterium]|jgi:RND superfamily putative drug exporter